MNLNLVRVNQDNRILIQNFLKIAGKSLETFRYFNSRDVSIIKNHKLTIVALIKDKPIGYGHLDEDLGKVWLGIAVGNDYIGKGYGNEILQYLLSSSIRLKIKEIHLSVDRSNKRAITLYEKNSFFIYKEDSKVAYLKRINILE